MKKIVLYVFKKKRVLKYISNQVTDNLIDGLIFAHLLSGNNIEPDRIYLNYFVEPKRCTN